MKKILCFLSEMLSFEEVLTELIANKETIRDLFLRRIDFFLRSHLREGFKNFKESLKNLCEKQSLDFSESPLTKTLWRKYLSEVSTLQYIKVRSKKDGLSYTALLPNRHNFLNVLWNLLAVVEEEDLRFYVVELGTYYSTACKEFSQKDMIIYHIFETSKKGIYQLSKPREASCFYSDRLYPIILYFDFDETEISQHNFQEKGYFRIG